MKKCRGTKPRHDCFDDSISSEHGADLAEVAQIQDVGDDGQDHDDDGDDHGDRIDDVLAHEQSEQSAGDDQRDVQAEHGADDLVDGTAAGFEVISAATVGKLGESVDGGGHHEQLHQLSDGDHDGVDPFHYDARLIL